jgi:hypothetical protein
VVLWCHVWCAADGVRCPIRCMGHRWGSVPHTTGAGHLWCAARRPAGCHHQTPPPDLLAATCAARHGSASAGITGTRGGCASRHQAAGSRVRSAPRGAQRRCTATPPSECIKCGIRKKLNRGRIGRVDQDPTGGARWRVCTKKRREAALCAQRKLPCVHQGSCLVCTREASAFITLQCFRSVVWRVCTKTRNIGGAPSRVGRDTGQARSAAWRCCTAAWGHAPLRRAFRLGLRLPSCGHGPAAARQPPPMHRQQQPAPAQGGSRMIARA